MKRLLFLGIGLIISINVNGQSTFAYEEFIAKADLYHLQKNQAKAIALYESAFRLRKPDALNSYKAAGVYSLDGKIGKAAYYLKLALKLGWVETDMLFTDPYFYNLKKVNPQIWRQIVADALALEKKYEVGLQFPKLRKEINLMANKEQRLRYGRVQGHSTSDENKIIREIQSVDSSNRSQAKIIIKQFGWPKISDIGKDGQNNLWLIVQHADDDVLFQKTALLAMEKLMPANELVLENYAFLYDRVQCNLNFRQLYGTQVNWLRNGEAASFKSITDESSVNERREGLGMLPMKVYALSYGFFYDNVTAIEAKKSIVIDRSNVRNLIDSATRSYDQQVFDKVYEYYNKASMIVGGMEDAETFVAAKLFAEIAVTDSDPRYKSICLDFLNLLYLRNVLSRDMLSNKVFDILSSEPRWVFLSDQIH